MCKERSVSEECVWMSCFFLGGGAVSHNLLSEVSSCNNINKLFCCFDSETGEISCFLHPPTHSAPPKCY